MTSCDRSANRPIRSGSRRSAFAQHLAQPPGSARQLSETFRMESVPGEAATAVERHPCPGCAVPAGSACRTRAGRTAAKYHTARFILVPSLREELTVAVPAERSPGKPWTAGPPVAAAEPEVTAVPIRIGYARCSSATQELQSQLDALTRKHSVGVLSGTCWWHGVMTDRADARRCWWRAGFGQAGAAWSGGIQGSPVIA